MPEIIFKYNAVTSFIQGGIAFIVVAVGAFSIIAIAYVLFDILRDSRQYQRKQILRGYERAELIGEKRLETSEITGVLYSYRKGA